MTTHTPKLRFPEFSDKWEVKKIGEVVELFSGFPFSGDDFGGAGFKVVTPKNFTKTGRPVFTTENTKLTTQKVDAKYICKKGDLLILLTDLTQTCELLGKPIYLFDDEKYLLNQRIVRVEFNNSKLKNQFLLYVLLTDKYHKYIKETASGSTVRHSSNKIVLNAIIPFPSFSEQTKIANFLTAIDEKLHALKQKKTLLEQYKKGIMQQIFSQQLRFKNDDGTDFPDWEEKSLGEIANKKTKKNVDEKVKEVFTNSAIQGIVSQRDYFDKDIANQNNLSGYYVVDNDDFIYNPRISKFAPVGPISRNHLGQGVMSPLYTVFDIFEGNRSFFEIFFSTNEWHEYMESIANYGARFDRMNITTNDFFKMPVPFPTLPEQQKIASFLSAIDKKIEIVNERISTTETYKKGLLQQMFI